METSEEWFEKEKRKIEQERDNLIAAIPNRVVKVNRGIDLDMDKLFDVKISKAIKYLTKMKDLYGDNNISLAQYDPYAHVECFMVRKVDESDEDALSRINEEKGKIESIMYDKINRARIKSLEIKKLESKISALSNSEY